MTPDQESRVLAEMRRILRALDNSIDGLKAAFRHELGFRWETAALVLLGPLGLWLGADAAQRAALVGSLLVVLVAELVNSAIEATVDRIGDDPHELSGRAKDMGSAAVFLAVILAGLTWGLVLGERWLW